MHSPTCDEHGDGLLISPDNFFPCLCRAEHVFLRTTEPQLQTSFTVIFPIDVNVTVSIETLARCAVRFSQIFSSRHLHPKLMSTGPVQHFCTCHIAQ